VKVRYGSYSCKQTRREHTCSTLIGDRLRPIGLGAAYSETGKRGSEAGRVPRSTDLCHFTAFRRVEGLRRNDFMLERMIRRALPLTSRSALMCLPPSPRNQWPMHGTHGGGSTGSVDDLAPQIVMHQRRDRVGSPLTPPSLFSVNR